MFQVVPRINDENYCRESQTSTYLHENLYFIHWNMYLIEDTGNEEAGVEWEKILPSGPKA